MPACAHVRAGEKPGKSQFRPKPSRSRPKLAVSFRWPNYFHVLQLILAKIISTDSFISLNGRCATSRYLQVVGSIHDIESYFGIDNTLSLNLQIFTAHWDPHFTNSTSTTSTLHLVNSQKVQLI